MAVNSHMLILTDNPYDSSVNISPKQQEKKLQVILNVYVS